MNWALLSLFAALALFWLSTRQFALLWRSVIWLAGAALLTFAGLASATQGEFGIWDAINNALARAGDIENSALGRALSRNAPTVTRFISQLNDFFVLAGIVIGLLSAAAFTKGERLERALRPIILAMMAFVIGSVATLAVVAIGLGGQVKPRTFTGYVSQTALNDEPSVYDGDTFSLGEISLRLWGVDAPEMDQLCRGIENCGDISRAELERLIVGALVQCDQKQSIRSGRLTESFGRPLVQCWRINGAERIDVAGWMISNGFAVPYENNDQYGYENEARLGRGRGILVGCSLRPEVWRSRQQAARDARIAFERGDPIADSSLVMGNCS